MDLGGVANLYGLWDWVGIPLWLLVGMAPRMGPESRSCTFLLGRPVSRKGDKYKFGSVENRSTRKKNLGPKKTTNNKFIPHMMSTPEFDRVGFHLDLQVDDETVFEVLIAAGHLQVTSVVQQCCDYLQTQFVQLRFDVQTYCHVSETFKKPRRLRWPTFTK